MSELIKITTNNEGIQLVSARELYLGLGYDVNKGNFARWIKQMLESVDAIEGEEYTSLKKKTSEQGGKPLEDYIITVNIAKEICMIVGAMPRTNDETKKLSKEFRKYFIKCEEQLKQLQTPSYMIDDKIARAERWIIEERQRQALAEKVKELQPKADYYDDVLVSDGLLTSTQIAKEFGISGRKLNELLNELGVQYKQGKIWVLYAKYADKGYTKYITHLVQGAGSVTYTSVTCSKWTQKGRKFLHDILAENGIYPIC